MRNVRKDFPIFKRRVDGRPLIYLDSAATSQKPEATLKAVRNFSSEHYANVHRGIYKLSEEATELYETARSTIAAFIGAKDPHEVVFTSGTTEGINLLAYSWGMYNLKKGDVILLSLMEHHANIVPWQVVARQKGARLVYVGLTPDGRLDLRDLKRKLTRKVKIVSLTHASNVLGTINPIEKISKILNSKFKILKYKPLFVVDGAQSTPHVPINVKKLGCDFFVFSGHKLYGPTGVGVLWGRKALLDRMEPYQTGGQMIREVYLDRATWNDVPWKFEAGTPPSAGAIGLAAATKYLQKLGTVNIRKHESELTVYALKRMARLPYITIVGPKTVRERGSLISFNVRGLHAHDAASLLDEYGVSIRAGHHCAMPLHIYLGLDATVRISMGVYTTKKDIDIFIDALGKISKRLRL